MLLDLKFQIGTFGPGAGMCGFRYEIEEADWEFRAVSALEPVLVVVILVTLKNLNGVQRITMMSSSDAGGRKALKARLALRWTPHFAKQPVQYRQQQE